ncbi:hypothetical protein CX676_14060 [Paracoccus zhejiangensis]|uniref:Integrase catalytic domain-containing protein n=1 Tax=Paracoccus zhejiangensis TaxID=1077935 RepID=A0A2H5F0T6_9RHOB|nr:hypothetical protein CX676_14060 [Paracoccus zhejiangensis]
MLCWLVGTLPRTRWAWRIGGFAMAIENLPAIRACRPTWNKGRIVGQKRPLLPKHVWAIRVRLEIENNVRDLALFNLAIDSKLGGCELMGVARSSFYADPGPKPGDTAIIAEIRTITDEFDGYGYRRVGAELHHRGIVVNSKKVRRLMKENELNPRRRRRFVRTTDSDHGGPIFPFTAKKLEVHGPDHLWEADLNYIAIQGGFAYAALILDAWSRRVVGHAVGRGIDARLAAKALENAIAERRPLPGCVFHTDRGSQYASELHRAILDAHGFFGSMSRHGNPYDNAKAESFMKTLKVEDAYLMEYETYEEVAVGVPRFIEAYKSRRLYSALGVTQPRPVRRMLRPRHGQKRPMILSTRRGALHIQPQPGNEGPGAPVPERGVCVKPGAAGGASAQARHLGGDSRLIDEDQPVRLTAHRRHPPVPSVVSRGADPLARSFRRDRTSFKSEAKTVDHVAREYGGCRPHPASSPTPPPALAS